MTPDIASSPLAAPADSPERRMQDLQPLVQGLVHDLRNPLSVIKNNLYLLRQRLPEDDPRIARSLNRIDDQVGATMRILEGLQAIYRSESPAPQRVNLNELVQGAVPQVENIEVELRLAGELPLISADPHLLDPAVRALFRNAVESLPAPGRIEVETCQSGGSVRLVVRDHGEGISPEALSRAFEPLFSTRKGHGGLGLAMVAKVAAAHGGRVFLEPAEGGGTVAVLELPVADPG
jgi:signal transduction histidine kinase